MAHSLAELAAEARNCTACPLWRNATQTVFGEGSGQARVVLIGEQPGDAEDRAGRPFVGPAGKVLDRALSDAGLERDELYVTNAVKHFKWEPRGRRRLHKTPAAAEIAACRRWLDGELEVLQPRLLICLGATAAHAVLGAAGPLSGLRGRIIERAPGPAILATVHPSYILRVPPDLYAATYQGMVGDLRVASSFLTTPGSP